MVVSVSREQLKNNRLFRGLSEEELEQVAKLCSTRTYNVGDLCQVEGQIPDEVHIITKGKLGVEFRIPNIAYGPKEIILDTLTTGDIFGWSGLLKENPWSTLKAIEPTEVIYATVDDLLNLFNENNHIGLLVIKNLAGIITSGLRRTRMATLNAVVAIKGGY